MDAKEKYKNLMKKYGLPRIENIEEIFAFKLSKDSESPLFDISKGILESIDYAEEILEFLLFLSEGSKPSHFYEAKFIDRKKYFRIYRKILELKWKYVKTYFDPKEKNIAEFIKESYSIWTKDVKKNLISLGEKLSKSWRNYKEGENKEKQTYLG